MKRHFITLLCVAFLFSGCLYDLEKEGITNQTIYKGRVIDSNSKPLSGIMVRITNGKLIHNSNVTNNDGIFEVSVDISKIDDKYYIQIGEDSVNIKGALKGFGHDIYDFGDIPFVDTKKPVVETCGLTDMTPNSFTVKCEVKSQGAAKVTERGVCWSTNIPTINDNKQPFGSGNGIYSCTVSRDFFNFNTTTYYARAYAENEFGVAYGEPIVINQSRLAYFSLPSMEFSGYTYHIHSDLGGMQWEQGMTACENLEAYGYDDWFLPNKEEMLAIAEKTEALNKNNIFWTSSETYAGHYRIIHLDERWVAEGGSYVTDTQMSSNIYHIIPVRKDR